MLQQLPYLAVDSDLEVCYREAAVWEKTRGIGMERADTMNEAIQKLMQSNDYLYIGINSDVVDFMPLLKLMRSTTNIPILIATSNFTTEMEVAALANGADLYARFHKTTEGNIASVLAHIARMNEQRAAYAQDYLQPPQILPHGCMLIFPEERRVFVNDIEICLTPMEYDILHYLRTNRGAVLTFDKIFNEIWHNDYENATAIQLRNHIKRMKKKLTDADPDCNYIENIHGTGYKFSILTDKQ